MDTVNSLQIQGKGGTIEGNKPFPVKGMDSILCWNIRGLNSPSKQREVNILCNRERVGLIGLVETKIKVGNIQETARTMFGGWEYITNLQYHYNGRIWLSGRPDIYHVVELSGNAQAITCQVTQNSKLVPFLLTMVYGMNSRVERKELWKFLEMLTMGCNDPWLVMGDFNSILNLDDRKGGSPVCVTTCELLELPPQGNRYTWSDKHGIDRVYSKIDWVFVNNLWLNRMHDYTAIFMNEGISDRCPMKIEQITTRSRKNRQFKYCNVWASHPMFMEKVEAVWRQEIKGCLMFQVMKKLKLLKQHLKDLNKQYFNNILKVVDEDRDTLDEAQQALYNDPNNLGLKQMEKEKYDKFRRSSYLAEIYLQQRSKATWIQLSDDTTKYFYSVIKHKNLQQAIMQIKDKHGVTQNTPDGIAKVMVDFYQELLDMNVRRIATTRSFIRYGQLLYLEQ